jgi:AraC-like DNA-binding protein
VNGRGWSYDVHPGQVAVVDTGIYFSVSAGDAGAKGYYILVDGPQCHTLLKESGLWQGVFENPAIPKEWLEWIAMGVVQSSRQTVVAHTAHQLFIKVGQQARELSADPTLWDACQYLQTHWGMTQLNVDLLSAHLGVSRSKLYELFKVHLCISVVQYLSSIRLFHTKLLLANSDMHISGIAETCGFADASYFSSWFRKQPGVAPSKLRASGSRT